MSTHLMHTHSVIDIHMTMGIITSIVIFTRNNMMVNSIRAYKADNDQRHILMLQQVKPVQVITIQYGGRKHRQIHTSHQRERWGGV